MTDQRDPYAALLALVEREHALVVAGEWEPLAAIERERGELMATLGAPAPAGAAAALARCLEIQPRTTALLAARVAELRRELGHVAQGRTAVKGYGGALVAPLPRVDIAG